MHAPRALLMPCAATSLHDVVADFLAHPRSSEGETGFAALACAVCADVPHGIADTHAAGVVHRAAISWRTMRVPRGHACATIKGMLTDLDHVVPADADQGELVSVEYAPPEDVLPSEVLAKRERRAAIADGVAHLPPIQGISQGEGRSTAPARDLPAADVFQVAAATLDALELALRASTRVLPTCSALFSEPDRLEDWCVTRLTLSRARRVPLIGLG